MKKYSPGYVLFLMFVLCIYCKGQVKPHLLEEDINTEKGNAPVSHGPHSITRNMIQDRKGNIWIASWEGIFRYDGKSFINITGKATSSHFFSVLEDRSGNLWFGSIGSGVYRYHGKSLQNFTTKDGLAENSVTCIYEDRAGNIWFGTGGGASEYDGKTFKNFTTKDGLPSNDINSIVEDKTGKFWFGTRNNTCIYNGKTFTTLTHDGKPFTNVRTILKDKKGNIWLGGSDGLWCYNGGTFTNFTRDVVGYVYEDKKGNIWTSSERKNGRVWGLSVNDLKPSVNQSSALSRYDGKLLLDKKPAATEITRKGMICGILEDNDGNIWFGSVDGVYRYHGDF